MARSVPIDTGAPANPICPVMLGNPAASTATLSPPYQKKKGMIKMLTKTIYSYDEKGYFTHPIVLDDTDKSPSGSWNVPANTVDFEPPIEKEGYKIKLVGNAWEYEQEESAEPEQPEPTFEELQAQKISSLKYERDRLEVEPIAYNGSNFDYDDKARDRINAAIIALEMQPAEATIMWTTADNTDVAVGAADLKNVIAAVAVRSNALHIQYRIAKEKALAATTKAELEEITLD